MVLAEGSGMRGHDRGTPVRPGPLRRGWPEDLPAVERAEGSGSHEYGAAADPGAGYVRAAGLGESDAGDHLPRVRGVAGIRGAIARGVGARGGYRMVAATPDPGEDQGADNGGGARRAYLGLDPELRDLVPDRRVVRRRVAVELVRLDPIDDVLVPAHRDEIAGGADPVEVQPHRPDAPPLVLLDR